MEELSELFPKGQRLGKYQLIRRLAVGGMAEIYLAQASGLEGFEKLIVIKRILPQHALDPQLRRMFLDEARLMATLTHPHITQVYDVGNDGDAPFFAMEYVHGANLREIMNAAARAAGQDHAARELPLHHAIGDPRGGGGRAALRARADRAQGRTVAHRASRRVTVERARDLRRVGQGLGLRDREVVVAAHPDAGGRTQGQVRLHVARAVPRRRARSTQRRLRARHAALRADHRQPAVPRRERLRDPEPHRQRRAAAADAARGALSRPSSSASSGARWRWRPTIATRRRRRCSWTWRRSRAPRGWCCRRSRSASTCTRCSRIASPSGSARSSRASR